MCRPPPLPPGLWHLLKSIYELKRASRIWYRLLRKVLETLGFVWSEFDHALFILNRTWGTILVHCLLTMHVDDSLGGCNLGNFLSFLDLSGESLLAKHELTTSNSVVTPLNPLHSPGCEDNSYPAVENFTRCQHLISPLLLSQLNSRPDISFAVPLLSQICSALLPQHYAVSRHAIRHPNGTKSFRLTSIDFNSCLVSISSCYLDCISTSALSLASNHSFIRSHIKSGDFDIIHIDLLPGFKRHFRHLHCIFSNFCRYCTVFKVDVPSFAGFFPVSQPQKCNTCVSHALSDVILAHAYWFQFSAELLSCDFMAFHCRLTVVTSFQWHCSFSSSTSRPHAIHLDSSRSHLFKLDNPRNITDTLFLRCLVCRFHMAGFIPVCWLL